MSVPFVRTVGIAEPFPPARRAGHHNFANLLPDIRCFTNPSTVRWRLYHYEKHPMVRRHYWIRLRTNWSILLRWADAEKIGCSSPLTQGCTSISDARREMRSVRLLLAWTTASLALCHSGGRGIFEKRLAISATVTCTSLSAPAGGGVGSRGFGVGANAASSSAMARSDAAKTGSPAGGGESPTCCAGSSSKRPIAHRLRAPRAADVAARNHPRDRGVALGRAAINFP